ncbi:MAG: ribonuclease P protein component [Acidobacteria bacterium]|nr:ribonuclease P protein component [Acidobacteriota bacterium]
MVIKAKKKLEKQSRRLCSSKQFRKIYQEGQRFGSPYFTVFVVPNDLQQPRYGITATRKVGNSVLRNRCKRRIRAAFQQIERTAQVHLIGLDLVINVKTELAKAEFASLVEAFERTLTRAESFWRKKLDEPAVKETAEEAQ